MQAEKHKGLPNYTMKQKLEGVTKNMLKRSSFVHEGKRLSCQHQEALPTETTPLYSTNMPQAWLDHQIKSQVHTTVPEVASGLEQDGIATQSLTLATIEGRHPQEAWIHVYNEWSVTSCGKLSSRHPYQVPRR